jgi:pimeloyl-ACP methyl ester carboxylesterase
MIPSDALPTLTRTPLRFRAADGRELSMTRIYNPQVRSRGPIVMQHGLGSNSLVFDYPGRSLVQSFANAGFDCYLSELRGARGASSGAYGLTEYIEYDLPAIIETVRAASGQARLHWIGHSLGGLLMMMYAIERPDVPIERFVAIGSAMDYRPGRSIYRRLRLLKGLVANRIAAIPFDSLSRWNALVAGHGPKLLPEEMNFWRENIEPGVMRGLMRNGFSAIPMHLMLDLDTTFGANGFSRGKFAYLSHANAFRLRSCLLVGTRDEQCGEAAVDETARLLVNAPEMRVSRFGRAYGHANDYGHFDLIVGKRAEREVWPVIRSFIDADKNTDKNLDNASNRERSPLKTFS